MLNVVMPSVMALSRRHYDNTFKDNTYDDLTYNINKCNITYMFLSTVTSKVINM
jgi:hypothetical protein